MKYVLVLCLLIIGCSPITNMCGSKESPDVCCSDANVKTNHPNCEGDWLFNNGVCEYKCSDRKDFADGIYYEYGRINYDIDVDKPSPCYDVKFETIMLGAEQIILRFNLIPPKPGIMCAQVIDTVKFKGILNVSAVPSDVKVEIKKKKINSTPVVAANVKKINAPALKCESDGYKHKTINIGLEVIGYCIFENSICEEWEYLHGDCKKGDCEIYCDKGYAGEGWYDCQSKLLYLDSCS